VQRLSAAHTRLMGRCSRHMAACQSMQLIVGEKHFADMCTGLPACVLQKVGVLIMSVFVCRQGAVRAR
jgi:hypothetical protein